MQALGDWLLMAMHSGVLWTHNLMLFFLLFSNGSKGAHLGTKRRAQDSNCLTTTTTTTTTTGSPASRASSQAWVRLLQLTPHLVWAAFLLSMGFISWVPLDQCTYFSCHFPLSILPPSPLPSFLLLLLQNQDYFRFNSDDLLLLLFLHPLLPLPHPFL